MMMRNERDTQLIQRLYDAVNRKDVGTIVASASGSEWLDVPFNVTLRQGAIADSGGTLLEDLPQIDAEQPVTAVLPRSRVDVALDPQFKSKWVAYWTYAEPHDGGVNNTAAARGKLVDGAAAERAARDSASPETATTQG
jgi:glucose/arabinose dehydrogenase